MIAMDTYLKIPNRAGQGVCFPTDLGTWVEGMKQTLANDGMVYLSACDTDWPGQFAVGFCPGLIDGATIQERMQGGKVFGFYVDANLARELQALFGLIATTLEANS
jgi:hypothetical protein